MADEVQTEAKKPWLSKTVWLNVVSALAVFIPGASEWIAAHPDMMISLLSLANVVLRLVSKDAVNLK